MLFEQGHNVLAVLVGDAERLNTQLLLNLQGIESGGFLIHVGIDQCSNAALNGVDASWVSTTASTPTVNPRNWLPPSPMKTRAGKLS